MTGTCKKCGMQTAVHYDIECEVCKIKRLRMDIDELEDRLSKGKVQIHTLDAERDLLKAENQRLGDVIKILENEYLDLESENDRLKHGLLNAENHFADMGCDEMAERCFNLHGLGIPEQCEGKE